MSDDKQKMAELEKIAEKYKKRNKYINEWQKNKYYRLTVLKPLVFAILAILSFSCNGINTVSDYIKALIDNDMQTQDGQPNGSQEGFQDFQPGLNDGLPFG